MNRTPGHNVGKSARTVVLAIVCVLLSLTTRAGAVMPSAMRAEIEEADGIGKSSDSVSVKIYYRWDNFDIDTTYLGNGASLREIERIFNRSLRLVDSIYIISSASPEGNVRYNARLSENRGLALKRQLAGIWNDGRLGDVTIFPLGSNFPEFLGALEADDRVPSRAEILREFASRPKEHPDTVYRQIMKMDGGAPYTYIKRNILPYLRYAEVTMFSKHDFRHDFRHDFPPMPEVPGLIPVNAARHESENISLAEPAAESGSKQRKYWYPALKTNLLYDAVTALNAEVEFPITKKFSILVEDVFPWWKWGTNDKQYCFQLWTMGVEPRWWFRRTDKKDWLSGHFAGVYVMAGKYDLQWKTKPCYQGEYWSAGLTYGYAMPICKWLNMELSVSAGYISSDYRHYQPDDGYDHLYRDKFKVGRMSWFGPTKLKVSLVLPLWKDSHNR